MLVILGLGTNLGDKLTNLRKALTALKKIPDFVVLQVSPVYISAAMLPDNAPADWDQPYLNVAVRCETIFSPQALQQKLKLIEACFGKKEKTLRWAPRSMDIDILAYDEAIINEPHLQIPHYGLLKRPFALWPLADVAPSWRYQGKAAAELVEVWGSRFSGIDAPFHTKQICQRIDTPQLVGILNITPDSFSDGGKFLTTENAAQQAIQLVSSGAEILDLGAESTAPHVAALSPETEWQRLEPVLLALQPMQQFILPPKISVDTRHPEVAAKALALGVDWINDVTGLQNPAMREVLATTSADCVVMHSLDVPTRSQKILPRDQDVVAEIYAWGQQQLDVLEKAGIARERVIFDPGIGFGKAAEHSFALIKNIAAFKQLGTRILVGHSRKSFLTTFTPHPAAERDVETLAIAIYLAQQAIDYLRIHHVECCARGLKISAALNCHPTS